MGSSFIAGFLLFLCLKQLLNNRYIAIRQQKFLYNFFFISNISSNVAFYYDINLIEFLWFVWWSMWYRECSRERCVKTLGMLLLKLFSSYRDIWMVLNSIFQFEFSVKIFHFLPPKLLITLSIFLDHPISRNDQKAFWETFLRL